MPINTVPTLTLYTPSQSSVGTDAHRIYSLAVICWLLQYRRSPYILPRSHLLAVAVPTRTVYTPSQSSVGCYSTDAHRIYSLAVICWLLQYQRSPYILPRSHLLAVTVPTLTVYTPSQSSVGCCSNDAHRIL